MIKIENYETLDFQIETILQQHERDLNFTIDKKEYKMIMTDFTTQQGHYRIVSQFITTQYIDTQLCFVNDIDGNLPLIHLFLLESNYQNHRLFENNASQIVKSLVMEQDKKVLAKIEAEKKAQEEKERQLFFHKHNAERAREICATIENALYETFITCSDDFRIRYNEKENCFEFEDECGECHKINKYGYDCVEDFKTIIENIALLLYFSGRCSKNPLTKEDVQNIIE